MSQVALKTAFISLLAVAAAAPSWSPLDRFGKALAATPAQKIDELFGYYQELKDFSAEFQQTKQLHAEGLELKSSGTLKVSLGRALLWDVEAPARLTVFLDASTLRVHAGEGKTATDTTYDLKTSAYSEKLAQGLKELTALLSMNKDEVAKGYDVAAEEKAGEAPSLILTPKVPHQFKRVRMTVAGRWIGRIEIDEASGDRLLLDFKPPQAAGTEWIGTWTKGG
jgi:outer membrane lipoprotein-sorting protein